MPTPQERLAKALESLKALQEKTGSSAIRSRVLTRTVREQLLKNGFIQEVMKGWYIPTHPQEVDGESTAWYASFWDFSAEYLTERFGNDWCLTAQQSLALHTDDWMVPKQLIVQAPKGNNNIIELLHGTQLVDSKASEKSFPSRKDRHEIDGLQLYSLEAALIACPPVSFLQSPALLQSALATVKDTSELLSRLLDGEHTHIAGRLAGAFRNIKYDRQADTILGAMIKAGYNPRESDPFEDELPTIKLWTPSPAVNRMKLKWQTLRDSVIEHFPKAPGRPNNISAYLERVGDVYKLDAYHSLSIEGYKVSAELIDNVRSGNWHPDQNEQDKEQRNAMAARGYWQAFQAVQKSIEAVLRGENPGTVVQDGHNIWYRELFAPSVKAGLIKNSDLAGYRRGQVFIRSSMHIPVRYSSLPDLMPAFFDFLKEEEDPAVRVVLGHFIFVYIHPYMDGNGRMGRFLMNAMLADGGYPWTVIPVEKRTDYLSALETASVDGDIVPFTKFLADCVNTEVRPIEGK